MEINRTLAENILLGLCSTRRFSALGEKKALKTLRASFSPCDKDQLEISALVFAKMCGEEPGLTHVTVDQARECVIFLHEG